MSDENTKNEGNDLLDDELDTNESSDQGNDQADQSNEGADDGLNDAPSNDDGSNDPSAPSDDEPSQEQAQPNVPKQAPARPNAQEIGISYNKMTKEMKDHLASQPKVHFMIPLSEGEKDGAYETVQINGYKMTIKKGTMVVVPQQVAEILADHYRISSEAGQEWRIDRKTDVESALS